MSDDEEQHSATVLCKSCGLCCTGHLFAWAKLKSSELKSAEALGLKVLGSGPNERGFDQPCPLWDGECTVYTSPHYPHFCRVYKCRLLRHLSDGTAALSSALRVVGETKELIREVEALLPSSSDGNFRERLVLHIEHAKTERVFQQKARQLLLQYKNQFGVNDLVDDIEETDYAGQG